MNRTYQQTTQIFPKFSDINSESEKALRTYSCLMSLTTFVANEVNSHIAGYVSKASKW